MPTETIENETQVIDANAYKFDDQKQQFIIIETALATCRAFIAKHHDTLAPLNWTCYGWCNQIKFHPWRQEPKEIARAFGSSDWTREYDRYSSEAVNWKKEMDGMLLIIENAESIKRKLNEHVRL